MFERDLPGENKSGLSFQEASAEVPVETCETINGSWGYNITDKRFKTVDEIVRLLAGAAGRSTNLLLNVGPMPNGLIQPEFCDSLAGAGKRQHTKPRKDEWVRTGTGRLRGALRAVGLRLTRTRGLHALDVRRW